jgi:hypothetical protein
MKSFGRHCVLLASDALWDTDVTVAISFFSGTFSCLTAVTLLGRAPFPLILHVLGCLSVLFSLFWREVDLTLSQWCALLRTCCWNLKPCFQSYRLSQWVLAVPTWVSIFLFVLYYCTMEVRFAGQVSSFHAFNLQFEVLSAQLSLSIFAKCNSQNYVIADTWKWIN